MALFKSRIPAHARHILEDPDRASAFLAQLPSGDPLAVLQSLSSCLDKLKTSSHLTPTQVFEIIDLVDRSARPHYRKVVHAYTLAHQRLTKFQSDRLWSTVAAYVTELNQAYRYCLSKYQVGSSGASALHGYLPLICCRAMRAGGARLKWSYLRYRPAEPGQWAELNSLYLLAESADLAQAMQRLYRGAERASSVRGEFLNILMLAVASPGSLLPAQVEIAERVIAHCVDEFVIDTRTPDTLRHFIDLRSDTGPSKLPLSRKINRESRAFGACQALDQVRALLHAAEEDRFPSAQLGLNAEFDPQTIRATLRHLLRYWDRPLPERAHSRERHVARIAIVHDYDEVVANVGGLALEYPFVSEQESWIVDNRSRIGLHALVPSPQGRWVQVGSLLAFREDEESVWRPAIVRRIVQEDDDARYVGLETLADGGAAVTIFPGIADASRQRTDGTLCILLAGRNGPNDQVSLLLPAGAYSRKVPLHMRAYDQSYRLVPIRLTESGDGYRVGRFRILRPNV